MRKWRMRAHERCAWHRECRCGPAIAKVAAPTRRVSIRNDSRHVLARAAMFFSFFFTQHFSASLAPRISRAVIRSAVITISGTCRVRACSAFLLRSSAGREREEDEVRPGRDRVVRSKCLLSRLETRCDDRRGGVRFREKWTRGNIFGSVFPAREARSRQKKRSEPRAGAFSGCDFLPGPGTRAP